MARDTTISNMVRLPRLNALSAAALAEQLLTAAAAETDSALPLLIERQRARLAAAASSLKAQIQPQEEKDSGIRSAADKAVDDGWRSFYNWLGAMAGMPDGSFSELEPARTLYNTLFSDGLSFIILAYREEWTESETRLTAIETGGFEPLIAALGGTPFLANIKAAHTRYGEVLGIKAPLQAVESPLVRENLLTLINAMKSYAVKVAAFADPDEPGSEALSTALLLPLSQWKDTRSGRAAEPNETDLPDAAAE